MFITKYEPVMRLNLQQFAEGEGAEGSGAGDAGVEAPAENGENGANQAQDAKGKETESVEDLKATIAKLQADAARQKAAFDKVSHEAAETRKALKAKQTAEEIAADAQREQEEKRQQEYEELQRKVARAENTKAIMGKLNMDEDSAGELAENLRGCENLENALLMLQKAWTAREKALRLEFGKVTPPGAGADSNSPEARAIANAKEIGKRQAAVNEQAKKALGAYMR